MKPQENITTNLLDMNTEGMEQVYLAFDQANKNIVTEATNRNRSRSGAYVSNPRQRSRPYKSDKLKLTYAADLKAEENEGSALLSYMHPNRHWVSPGFLSPTFITGRRKL